jgi:hypothetical protein
MPGHTQLKQGVNERALKTRGNMDFRIGCSPSSRPNGWCSQHLPLSFPSIDDRLRDSQTQARHKLVSSKEMSASRYVVPRGEGAALGLGWLADNLMAITVAGAFDGTEPEWSLQKKILWGAKKCRFLSKHERVDFMGWNRVIFTKIHQTGKSCQSYRRFQNTICCVVGWRPFFDK